MVTKAIFFDIDGTLIDSNDLHVVAWGEAFEGIGVHVAPQLIHDQIGKGTDMLVPTLLPGLDKDARDAVGHAHGEIFKAKYLHRAKPFARAHDLLAHAHGNGQQVVLASSAAKAELDHYLEVLCARDLVDHTVTSEDVDKTKPAPDIFAAALKKLDGIAASDVIVVGDTPYDVEAAKKAGMDAIGLRSGKFPDAMLMEAGVLRLYDDVGSLLDDYTRSPLGLPGQNA